MGACSPIRGCSTCARSGVARCALRSARPCAPTRRPPPARPPAARPASAWRAPATVRINRLYRLYAPRGVPPALPGGADTHGTRHNRLQGRARASASLSSSSSRGRLLSSFTTSSPLQTCRGRGEALGVLWLPAKRVGWGACAVCGRGEGWDPRGGRRSVSVPRVGARALVVAPTRPKRCGSLARLSTALRGGPHSADGTAAPLNVARRTLLVHMRAGARLRPARVQAHDAHVPCGYAGGKPRINFSGSGVGFGSGGPRRAGF